MQQFLLTPPMAFITVLLTLFIAARLLSRLAFKSKVRPDALEKSYACGEDVADHRIRPDYSQFFPFAFFFTILHVVTLMLATIPTETIESFVIAIIYIVGILAGLSILFRRQV